MATQPTCGDPVFHFESTYPADKTIPFDTYITSHSNRKRRFVVRGWERKHPRVLYSADTLQEAIDYADCQPEFIDVTDTPVDVLDKESGAVVYQVVA